MIRHPVLDQLASSGIKLGLERVRAFLASLGDPQRAYPVVHVAGTNGKGSVCAMVSTALVRAGYQVGTNTSPHLEDVNERVRLNMLPISDGKLVEAIESLDRLRRDWSESMGMEEAGLTYFEFLTALAMMVFAQEGVDAAVFEVGLGGRLDATNVLTPQVTAITSIGMDHADVLGDSLDKIAAEKAGILKAGVPVVIGVLPAEAREVVERYATRLRCPIWRPGKELFKSKGRDGWSLSTPDGTLENVRPAMPGDHQITNALVALGVLHGLRREGFVISDEAIREGIEQAVMPGRLEELRPGLIIDGAHNRPATEALAAWLAQRGKKGTRLLLWGMGEGRDAAHILEPLLPYVDEVIATQCAHPKARKSHELAAALTDLDAVLADGGIIDEVLAEVYAEADETLVAGSLFVAGAARSLVRAGVLDGIEPGQGPLHDEEEGEEPEGDEGEEEA
ncbi:MAG: bifunctional folylpolyglutamate synthase/dihydrofolate synthase [Deltaproteobacteria bacterium]|nr:MAG: bifunctional folylpolyglutamate synthase/dihydrofolate synthase [Deltaproteobacteria bacterium]